MPKKLAKKTPAKPHKAGRGRPTKFTPETRQKILTALSNGNTYEASAQYGGVNKDTFREWIKQGEADAAAGTASEFSEFSDAVKKAEAQAEVASIARIRSAASGQRVIKSETVRVTPDGEQITEREYQYAPPQWQADAWFLERRKPQDWARRERHEVSQTSVNINWDDLTENELERIAAGESAASVLADRSTVGAGATRGNSA